MSEKKKSEKKDMSGVNEALSSVHWYLSKVPEKDEYVAATISSVSEGSVWLALTEYKNISGYIPLSNVTKRQSNQVPKQLKVGTKIYAQISQIEEKQNGEIYIDLTRDMSKDDLDKKAKERYSSYSKLLNLLYQASLQEGGSSFVDLVENVSYYLQARDDIDVYPYEYISNPDNYVQNIESLEKISRADKDYLIRSMEKKNKKGKSSVDRYFNASCKLLSDLKRCLSAHDDKDISILYEASPKYLMKIEIEDRVEGERRLDEAIKKIEAAIKEVKGGQFSVDN